jgi:hypothetical protein
MPTTNKTLVAVVALVLTVMTLGNSLNIEDFNEVSYRNHSDVVIKYPDGVEGSYYWENTSTSNVITDSTGSLTADSNSSNGRWVSEPLRINDNRKVVYEADIFTQGEVGITIQVSDNSTFNEIKDIEKADVRDGFNEIELNMDRGRYSRIIVDFDRNSDQDAAINRLNIQGVRSDVKTGFAQILALIVTMVLFYFAVRVMGAGFGWWR